MRVLVTGATGHVGSAVAKELLARGEAVRVLVRATSKLTNLEGTGVQLVRGDVLDAESVRAALDGCDAVIHAAGIPRIGGPPALLHAVNVEGVEIVLGAALERGVSRAVLTSSTAVLGGTREPSLADEETPGNAEALGIPYFTSKLRGERAGLALARRGLPLVVVRPSLVLGPGDILGSAASIVTGLARRRVPGYVHGGASSCDVRDVAKGHVEALLRGRAGEVYVLGGHNLRMDEMIPRICALAGVPPPRRMPLALAYGAAAAQEAFAKITGGRAATNRDLVRAAALYTFVSSAKAGRELGYAIRPFDEMVKDTLRFALATGRLRPETPELRALATEA